MFPKSVYVNVAQCSCKNARGEEKETIQGQLQQFTGRSYLKKGGAFFSLSKFFENRIEYMFGLLCGIGLIDAENLGIDKE